MKKRRRRLRRVQYLKRALAKACRRYIKGLLKTGRAKEPVQYESELNWRGT